MGTAGGATSGADSVQQARTRARHRLIGAGVLVAVGLVLFPMIFENEPRPVSPDIPIEIAGRKTTPAVDERESDREASGRTSRQGSAERPRVITETAAEAGREIMLPPPNAAARAARPAAQASAPRTLAAAAVKPVPKPAAAASAPRPVAARPAASSAKPLMLAKPPTPVPVPVPVAKTAPPPAARVTETPEPRTVARPSATAGEMPAAAGEGTRARMLLEGKELDEPKAEKVDKPEKVDAPGTRYVIQVGAFADGGTAQAARLKVERLGMKTYTHVAKTPGGERTRVRVGPVTSREEAERLQARLKAAGLAAAVLTL